jgi:hypothetical protein
MFREFLLKRNVEYEGAYVTKEYLWGPVNFGLVLKDSSSSVLWR